MELSRVQINTASTSEISELYAIGPHHAQQIVDYRVANGPFHGPTDLVKVGITPKLAVFLSPHIDWRLPEQPQPSKQRSWSEAGLWLVILACLLPVSLLMLILVVNTVAEGAVVEQSKIVAAAAGIGALLCFCGFAALRLGVALTRQRARAQQLARAALASMAIALLVGIPLLLGSAVYWWYQAGMVQDASSPRQPWPSPVMGVFALLLLYLLMIPQIVVWWRPQLAESRWLARTFDSTFLLAGLALIWGLRLHLEGWPFWFLLLAALAGGLMVVVALLAVRRGESFFRTSLDFLDVRRRLQATTTEDHWRHWVAIHLPDPAEQKSVQAALNQMYSSHSRQVVLLASAGGWLALTAIGAILEHYLQKFLDSCCTG